jgi:hypothetical protein
MGRKSVDKPDIDVMSGFFCVNGAVTRSGGARKMPQERD